MEAPITPIERAIKICGSQAKLAEKIGRSQQIISYWKLQQTIPADEVPAVEKATGISRHELRPDIFGPREGAAA